MAEDLDVAVAVVWTLIGLIIVGLLIALYLWMNEKACFAKDSAEGGGDTTSMTVRQNTTTMNQSNRGDAYGLFPRNLHVIKTIQASPSPGPFQFPPAVVVSLSTKFASEADRSFAIENAADRFRLYYSVSYAPDPYSKPVKITQQPQHQHGATALAAVGDGAGTGAGVQQYTAPIELNRKGKFIVSAYAVLWRGEGPLPHPVAMDTPGHPGCARFEYFLGVDPDEFALSLDLDFDAFHGAEGLLEMQRLVARHFRPPPGTYTAPLTVEVSNALVERYVLAISPQYMLVPDDERRFTLTVTGNHIVSLTARDSTTTRSLDMAAVYVINPPPPDITPNKGAITELMPVAISSPSCLTDVNLKHLYSIDGGDPTLLYNVPFTVPCGEGRSERSCRIIAKTIGRDGTQSEAVAADLQVLSSAVAVYDPNIPSPVCLVEALEPRLMLQHHEDEVTPSEVIFFYRVLPDERNAAAEISHSYQHFDREFQIYDPARPIPINDAHIRVEAYAERVFSNSVSRSRGQQQQQQQRERSSVVHYSWSESLLDAAHGFGDERQQQQQSRHNSRSRSRSSPAPHMSRSAANQQTSSYHHHQHHQHGRHNNSAAAAVPFSLVRPPIMSVVCSGAHLSFEDAPHKKYVIRYTLDGAQPDESTGKEFMPGSDVDVTEFLRAAGKIQVVARYFVERSAPTEPTRFGRNFSRDFTVPFFSSVS